MGCAAIFCFFTSSLTSQLLSGFPNFCPLRPSPFRLVFRQSFPLPECPFFLSLPLSGRLFSELFSFSVTSASKDSSLPESSCSSRLLSRRTPASSDSPLPGWSCIVSLPLPGSFSFLSLPLPSWVCLFSSPFLEFFTFHVFF